MSSQVLTMPGPGGLPGSPPPGPDLPFPAQSTLTDHMNSDRPTNEASAPPHDPITRERTSSSLQGNQHTSHQAVSNLLEALRTAQTSNAAQAIDTSGSPMSLDTSLPAMLYDTNIQYQPGDNDNRDTPANDGADFTNNQYPLDSSFDFPPFPPPLYTPDQLGLTTNGLPHMDPAPPQRSVQDKREVEAFAKIEFDDGNYYLTTWQCELGRDAIAYRAAILKAEEVARTQRAADKVQRPSDRVRRRDDSGAQSSFVSEAGGFGGIDEAPVAADPNVNIHGHPSQSSEVSDVVRPQEVLYHPPPVPFDYNRNAELHARDMEFDGEQVAPVTAEHMPDSDQCPIIPIHPTTDSERDEVLIHKSISRRHVRIEWDFDEECFQIKVLGRNGAFVDNEWLERGARKNLKHGSIILIAEVHMVFNLPRPVTETVSDDSEDEEEGDAINRGSTSPTSNEGFEADGQPTKFSPTNKAATTSYVEPLAGPDGQPYIRKRGPGRPPKDGIMSTRERKEREKAAKLAEAKAANGGRTPPPMARGKPMRPPEPVKVELKQEKRKYNKRKRDEDGDILPSIEGEEEDVSENESPPAKKPRDEKSVSPDYPPRHTLTEEQLQRPQEPYAKVIYDLLLEIHPKAIPLKGVYRMIKMRYPHYVYCVESDGWQSSVRHNLNQEWNKLFEKGEKEGKGYAWRAIPGAVHASSERKRAAPPVPPPKPKIQTPRNQQPQGQQQQSLYWQNNQPFPPQYWPQGQQGPYPQPPNGVPYPTAQPPPGHLQMPPTGIPPQQRPPISQSSTPQPNYPHLSQARPPFPGYPQQTAPQPANPGTAAPNMPCTMEGILTIRKFEESMYDQVRQGANPQSLEYWQQVFNSVKKRLLHGQIGSTMPAGETQEELIIMGYVRGIRDRFRNVNFVGFGERRDTPDVGQRAVRASSAIVAAGSVQDMGAVDSRRGSSATTNGDGQPTVNKVTMPDAQQRITCGTGAHQDRDLSKTASPQPTNGPPDPSLIATTSRPPA